MASKIILPKLGQTMEEGTIVEWVKQEGDPVQRDDVLFQIESDKAVLEVESKSRGVLRKILVREGVQVPVLTVVAIVAKEDEDISDLLAELAGGESAPAAESTPDPAPVTQAEPEPAVPTPVHTEGRIVASPRARKTAREMTVDLAYVAGTGPNGRIIEKDVLAYAAAQPPATPLARKLAQEKGINLAELASDSARITAEQLQAPAAQKAPEVAAPAPAAPPAQGELTPMRGVRAIIADRMGTSAHTTAAVTLQNTVDASAFVALRTQLKEALAKELGFNVGYNDLLAVIVARCLVEYPYMNVRLEEGGLRQLNSVNIGLAVDSERGLLVPVIHDAQKLGIKQFAIQFRELVARARSGQSLPDDLTGGTFTITNLGMFGVDMFTPIINLPESAILGVGRITEQPAVVDGQIAVRQKMWLSLTFDHRLVDGAPAARFLQGICKYIESPYLLLA